MAAPLDRSTQPRGDRADDDSPAVTLRQLEQDRRGLLTEKEYQQMRHAILKELARGVECRRFTLLTFATVGIGLLSFLILGVSIGHSHDYVLALTSGLALTIWGWLFWSFLQSIRKDAQRPLDERLAEVEELYAQQLISREEYDTLKSAVLMRRQG